MNDDIRGTVADDATGRFGHWPDRASDEFTIRVATLVSEAHAHVQGIVAEMHAGVAAISGVSPEAPSTELT
jgi:hypothetical protein